VSKKDARTAASGGTARNLGVVPRTRVFVSYSHRDKRHLDRLRVHLRPLEQKGVIDLWDDTRLIPGSEWAREIADAIDSAKVAILLVSADFLASSFIVENELPPLLAAAKRGGAAILPVVVGACRFTSTPELSAYQSANDPVKPLASLPAAERERVWVRVGDAIAAAFADRNPTDGWIVANEHAVLDSLNELVKCKPASFLIVSSGDHYVQFILESDVLHCEAVSDAYLPVALRFDSKQKTQLIAAGFAKPNKEFSNFSRRYPLNEVRDRLPLVAKMVVSVMSTIYHVSQNSKLEMQLTMEGEAE
jgi:hypothetical protein